MSEHNVELPIKGSCLCGAIHFEIDQVPSWSHHCHCSRCRKIRGSGFASNAFVPLESLKYTSGNSLLRRYKLPEAERFGHVFCSECGSSLPFENTARAVAVIPMGSLDDDPGRMPDAHIFVESKASWDLIRDDLPRHPEELGSLREKSD